MSRFLCIYILLILGMPCLAQQTKESKLQTTDYSSKVWTPLSSNYATTTTSKSVA